MASPKIDRLPSEILHMICGLVWKTSPESLRALSRANRICYEAAVPFLYGRLTIQFSNRDSLQRTVTELFEHHLRRQYLSYARRVDVFAVAESENRSYGPINCQVDELDPFLESDLLRDERAEEDSSEYIYYEEEDWEPLLSLVSCLQSSLAELNYAVLNEFPRSLLQVLHQRHPTCRLNIHTFRFLSPAGRGPDPYKLELMRSPCLHSIRAKQQGRDSDGNDDFSEEAVFRTVTVAPNLKHVHLWRCGSLLYFLHYQNRNVHREKWKGFIPPADTSHVGRLTSLTLSGFMGINAEDFEEWSRLADLAQLRSLTMGLVKDPTLPKRIAEATPFRNLERLSLKLLPSPGSDGHELRAAVELMFESLGPLRFLRIHGCLDARLIQTILSRHGQTLRGLSLDRDVYSIRLGETQKTVFSPADISSMAEACPKLEELCMPIKRFRGDIREFQYYEALGKFPCLQSLRLDLDCSCAMYYNLPSDEVGDRELAGLFGEPYSDDDSYNWHVADVFINAAVDVTLARAIWDAISASQSTGQLRRLRLAPFDGILFDRVWPSGAHKVVSHMSRSYLITRTEANGQSQPNVVEIGRQARERADEEERQKEVESMAKYGYRLDESLRKVFESIWPSRSDNKDWRLDWRSWPLQRTVPGY